MLQSKLKQLYMLDLKDNMINDFIPLLEMKEDRLQQVCESMIAEHASIPGGNRIHYFSSKLNVRLYARILWKCFLKFSSFFSFQIKPNIVAKYCVKNVNSLIAPFDTVDRKMQILLDYNIKPMSILKSMYALDRSEYLYISRLERLMWLNTHDVKIWLFKCADDVFEKYLIKMRQTNWHPGEEKIEPKSHKKIEVESKLNEMLECESKEAAHIYYSQISHFDQIDSAKQNIEFLTSKGVSLETITENSAVLTMQSGLFFFLS